VGSGECIGCIVTEKREEEEKEKRGRGEVAIFPLFLLFCLCPSSSWYEIN
jgi:hypothetical protein